MEKLLLDQIFMREDLMKMKLSLMKCVDRLRKLSLQLSQRE